MNKNYINTRKDYFGNGVHGSRNNSNMHTDLQSSYLVELAKEHKSLTTH